MSKQNVSNEEFTQDPNYYSPITFAAICLADAIDASSTKTPVFVVFAVVWLNTGTCRVNSPVDLESTGRQY